MPTAHGAIGSEQRIARQGEITDGIQHLVTDEFHRTTEALTIEDAVLTDGDRVIQRRAEGQPSLPELLDIVHEAEGAGDGQLVAKHTRIDIEGQALLPDERRIEVDLDVEMKPGMRRQLAPARAFLD